MQAQLGSLNLGSLFGVDRQSQSLDFVPLAKETFMQSGHFLLYPLSIRVSTSPKGETALGPPKPQMTSLHARPCSELDSGEVPGVTNQGSVADLSAGAGRGPGNREAADSCSPSSALPGSEVCHKRFHQH